MSTAAVVEAALALSNLRLRLNQAVGDATRRVFLGVTPRPSVVVSALHDLMEEADQVIDGLEPYAFYTDADIELLLGLSVAVSYARAGDELSAGRALVETFTHTRKAA